jgi:outer membrane autotransporter protein
VVPQAQLRYAAVDFHAFTDSFGSEIALERGDSLVGRLGVAIDYAQGANRLYAVGNLTYEFLEGTAVVVSGTDFSFEGQKLGAELGLGGHLEWNDGALALHGELLGRTSFEGSGGLKGTVGLTGRL